MLQYFWKNCDTAREYENIRFEISQVSNWTQERSWRQYNPVDEFIRVGTGYSSAVPCRRGLFGSCRAAERFEPPRISQKNETVGVAVSNRFDLGSKKSTLSVENGI